MQLVVAQAFLRLYKVRQGWAEEFLALLAYSPAARADPKDSEDLRRAPTHLTSS